MAFLSVFDVPTRAPSIPKAPPACQAAKSTAGQAVPPPATAGAVSGVPVAGIQQTTIHTFMVNRGTETHVFIHTYGGRKSPGYCWRTQKCRSLSVPHAFFEGKKDGETFPRKSTPRTLKGVRQQYPPVKWTQDARGNTASCECRETHDKKLCAVASPVGSFCTQPGGVAAQQATPSGSDDQCSCHQRGQSMR